ncbi:MAG: hypothetical protein NTV63_04130 [Candidatus Woesearchaeota archaeon]|nr:hypothetical protein [Candidatus Woesearchaeota archaeon]
MKTKQAMKALAVLIPVAFILYFWLASFLLFSGGAIAATYWDVNATVNVTNVASNVTLVTVDDNTPSPPNQIDLTAGGTTTVYCNGTINDTNGYADIASASAKLYDNVSATATSADNNETHYTNGSCSLDVGSGITRNAVCAFSLLYYSNNQSWICNITALDLDSASSSGVDGTAVNLLLALNISNNIINYGNLAPDETSASGATENITNHGNTQIDLKLNGTNMACSSVGSINVERQRYNVTGTDEAYATLKNLTGTAATTTTFDLVKRTDALGQDSKRVTYWRIQVPLGVKGRCDGNVTFAAIAG